MTALVDVNLVSCNHEPFIAQAIESVLAQQTDFEYRLVIAADGSTDRTHEIIRSYAERDSRIHTILEPENVGIAHPGRPGIKAFRASTAPYVAILDGDDFWTDPRKLQKQVDFLEQHPDYSISFHNARIQYENASTGPELFSKPTQKQTSTITDLLRGNFIFTGSVMFRNCRPGELPDWFHTCLTGDWVLHILSAQHGKIGYLNEVMAVYRVHHGGFWTVTDDLGQAKDRIKTLDSLEEYLDLKHRKTVRDARSYAYQALSEVHYQRGEFAE